MWVPGAVMSVPAVERPPRDFIVISAGERSEPSLSFNGDRMPPWRAITTLFASRAKLETLIVTKRDTSYREVAR